MSCERLAAEMCFLPAIQFSLAPWEYGGGTAILCKCYAALHTEFSPQILKIAEESACAGVPIIRPVWWLDAQDKQALLCDDEFLLGNDVLVSPMLQPAVRSHDFYLPKELGAFTGTTRPSRVAAFFLRILSPLRSCWFF